MNIREAISKAAKTESSGWFDVVPGFQVELRLLNNERYRQVVQAQRRGGKKQSKEADPDDAVVIQIIDQALIDYSITIDGMRNLLPAIDLSDLKDDEGKPLPGSTEMKVTRDEFFHLITNSWVLRKRCSEVAIDPQQFVQAENSPEAQKGN